MPYANFAAGSVSDARGSAGSIGHPANDINNKSKGMIFSARRILFSPFSAGNVAMCSFSVYGEFLPILDREKSGTGQD